MEIRYDPEEIQKLISQGVDITLKSQDGDIPYGENPVDNMHEVFSQYHLWKIAAHDFFWNNNFKVEAAYFFEADSVPMLKGGLAYSYIQSDKSQQLLRNIRREAKTKLEFLRNFIAKQPPHLQTEKVFFDEHKELLHIGNEQVEINEKTIAFQIIRVLFTEPERLHDKWIFSEISEYIDLMEKHDDRKFYNALKRFKEQLKRHQIGDFFEVLTTTAVKINPRYYI